MNWAFAATGIDVPASVLDENLSWALGLLMVITLATLATLVWVFLAKSRRDRAEARSRRLRQELARSLRAGDHDGLTLLVGPLRRGHLADQVDLLAVLTASTHEPWWTSEVTDMLGQALGRQRFVAQLERQLGHRSPARRGMALLLGAYPAARLRPDVIGRHLTDRDSSVRMAAAAALERSETAEGADTLIDALQARALPDPRVIERLAHPWAVATCRARLRQIDATSAGTARAALARALGLVGDSSAIPELLWLLERGNGEEAIQAMRALAACSPAGTVDQQEVISEAARARLGAEDPTLVLVAVGALEVTADPSDVERLAALATHPDWHVRRAVAHALPRFGARGIDALRLLAHGPDRFAADRAREVLALSGLRDDDGD